jgi:aquaporin Z
MILVIVALLTHADGWLPFITYSLAVVGLAFVIQPLSGCHLNPSVSIGETFDNEIYPKCGFTYIIFQLIGAIIGGIVLFFITGSDPHTHLHIASIDYSSFASIVHLPITNFILVFVFVFIVIGAAARYEKKRSIGLIIGFTLILEHAIGLFIHNASVNPMINIASAIQAALHGLQELINGGHGAAEYFHPLRDLWVYIVPAIAASFVAGLIIKPLFKSDHHAKNKAETSLHECHSYHEGHNEEHQIVEVKEQDLENTDETSN